MRVCISALIDALLEDPAGDIGWSSRQRLALQGYRASNSALGAAYDALIDGVMAVTA